jgi:cytosine/adenosine deaminase-related metal-dependent hydrolase
MNADGVLADQTVIVQGHKIQKIGPTDKIAIPTGALRIDGSGKFLMPGLADLHVHLFSPDDLLSYAAYGVTTVLNMSGSPAHLHWRKQVRDGTLLGPTIYTASPTVDGYPPLNETFVTEENPQQARAFIRECKQAGYDFIKLYGTLRPDVFRSILESAKKEKIPVVGHINRQVGALEVLKSNQVLAAHLEDLLFSRFDQPPNDADLLQFADAVAASHITVTPNLNVNPTNIAQLTDLNAVLESPDAQLLSPAAYSQWMPANNRNERNDQTPQQIEQMNQVQKILYHFAALLNARGVRLVLGTDAAPYGFPGLSAHQELEELIAAGFSPYQALLTATRNPGVFVAENIPNAPPSGTISEGSAADLLLLSANPLADIQNLKNIQGVMLQGRWLSAADLSKLQSAARAHDAPIKQRLQQIDAALESGDVAAARKSAQPLQSEPDPWIAEWVMMAKARKLQSARLPAAIQVARWNTHLYPDSFFAHYLLSDLLFMDNNLAESATEAEKSNTLEPHNAATLNLLERVKAVKQPLRFAPQGTYQLQLKNDQSGEMQTTEVVIEKLPNGRFAGNKKDPGGEPGPLRSVYAGGDRLWIAAPGPFGGSLELRITVAGTTLTGYWAGPFGHNGALTGKRTD